jgi:hypothetical protein
MATKMVIDINEKKLKKTCLWCSKNFEIKRKRVALCPDCRKKRHQEEHNNLRREYAERRANLLNEVLPDVPVELHSVARAHATQIINDLYSDPTKGSLAKVAQADGTKSRRGSDDGCSTWFQDLAAKLEIRAKAAEQDDWWLDHPESDVFFDL